MSKLEKQKEKARGLEGKDPKGAIEAWVEILKEGDAVGYRTSILIPTHPGTW